jgi:hypothetical protein
MTRVWAWVLSLAVLVGAGAACVQTSSDERGSASGACDDRTAAKNPVDGQCVIFESACDVPAEWPDCSPAPQDPGCAPRDGMPCAGGLDAGAAPPDAAGCFGNAACGPGEICPAQYGLCSTPQPGDQASCPSRCERACLVDMDCVDPADPSTAGRSCNAKTVCGQSTPGDAGVAIDCAGWCVSP